ncbi:MAG: cation transporter [Spirochaetes bacterium]|nr:cation transporter [Spirochaetota bacterium]
MKENQKENHDHNHGYAHITNKKRLVIVILFNSVITVAEYIGGIISGSLALISDAWHNLSDVLSLMLGYAGEKVSESYPSKKYSFGLKRFEVLIALLNALMLAGLGIYIVYEAVARFMHPVPVDVSVMIPVSVIALLGNVFSIIVLFKNKNSNLNIRAAFLHLLYDALSSVAVIAAGIILYFTGITWADLAASLIIVFMMVWSSAGIIKESFRIFLQGTPPDIDADEVYKNILATAGVGSLHGLHIWSVSSSEVFLSCHVCVDQSLDITNTDKIIKRVNSMLENKYGITHTTIQIENDEICDMKSGRCCR